MRPSLRLWFGLGGWLTALLMALLFSRANGRLAERCAARERLLGTLQPDLQRLARYEAAAALVRAAPPLPGSAAALPPPEWGLPPPQARAWQLLPGATEEWQGVQATLGWPSLGATQAFDLINRVSTSQPPWHVAALVVEALPEAGQVRCEVTLEGARALAPAP